ncbi:permease [Salinisphaera sp. C84B14]|uniref:SO_0444 family Cu/Zn efflux transporter n=1 Tax=Salinisphaera sp. C84B14 TaxID=1304155 RepID=UPI003340021E
MSLVVDIVINTWLLFLKAAPWLLLGLVIAACIRAFVPQARIAGWLGGRGAWPTIKAALIGAPLPLCSCSVIPVAVGLHRSGASRASTTSFLIATPETGADSVGASYALLGPFFTVVRPVAAIASAIITGLASHLMPTSGRSGAAAAAAAGCCASSNIDSECCASKPAQTSAVGDCCSTAAPATHRSAGAAAATRPADPSTGAGCCGSRETSPGVGARLAEGIHYAITRILDEFGLWLLIGLVVAGVTLTVVPPQTLSTYGSGFPAMLIMLAISVPLYVCATQSTPIATALLAAGMSPGAVLVFLLAGPATNLATIGAVRQEFGTAFAGFYVGCMGACALAFGLATDAAVTALGIDLVTGVDAEHALTPLWLSLPAVIVLVMISIRPLRAPLLQRLQQA